MMDMPLTKSKIMRSIWSVLLLITMLPVSAGASAPTAPVPDKANLQVQLEEGPIIEIGADSFGLPIADIEGTDLYDKASVILRAGEGITFPVEIVKDGFYTISFDMASTESFITPPEGQLKVDGDFPMADTRRIIFPNFYENSVDTFPLDRYGNDALIRQAKLIRWSTVPMRDANFSQPYPLQLSLTKGTHEFEFTMTKESMLLGSIYIQAYAPYPDYADYLAANKAADASDFYLEIEAEFPAYKDDTSIRPMSSRSLDVTPYDTYRLLFNTIGGDSWIKSGSTVFYEFEVPEDGMYLISLRATQNYKNNFTVFRRILINDAVPFEELNEVAFSYGSEWENVVLGGDAPYKIFLQKGKNVLGIEANNSPYLSAIEKIKKVLIDINTLSLEIKKLTGNQVDPYKEWVISDYIPDIKDRLIAIAEDLEVDMLVLNAINESGGSQEVLSYQMAIDNIRFLAADPDKIPSRMNRFSEGSASASQLLGNILPSLQEQPLALDKIIIYSPDRTLEQVETPFFRSFSEGLKRFFYSFRPNPYQQIGAGEDEIEVWVNRPRQYVDLLQSMTDESFTPDTGIKVKFSIMPNESKLVLANAAGIEPDVALGVSTNVPYELAIRNALKDLRTFDDFDKFIGIYSPGALLSYIINDSVYAIPETQDFWVTFYREDILNSLGIPVPDTWPEVIEILPELQRYGMNYNTPLSSGSGTKGYLVTAPYIFNYGAKLYSDDGFATGLESDEAITAIKFMTNSFTLYGMPLTTSSFYDSFRYGSLPIGVSNFTDYIKLMNAAPEINGLWKIALYPATVLADGTENRWATGSAQSCIMFKGTEKPSESWEFMKWWMSTETQVDFQQQLIMNYGLSYLWNSANLEAFAYSPIPEDHKAVILAQWEWLQEPVKLPGSYMQERELSNAWNKVVFDGVNPRVAIDSSVIIINREIARKMEEFGYLENGVRVKEFKIPTVESVRQWMENGGK